MSPLPRTCVVALGLALGCTVSLEDKTSCEDSQDCIDDRLCNDGTCSDGGCDSTCSVLCERADSCGRDRSACESECLSGSGAVVPSIGTDACKRTWDALQASESCSVVDCAYACVSTCRKAVECILVDDADACAVGCVADPSCPTATPSVCADVPADVLCWERGDDC